MLYKTKYNHLEEPVRPSKYGGSYVELSKARAIFLAEDFTKDVGSAVSAMLLHFDCLSKTEEITIYIHSNGGDASVLANIYDVIQIISAPVRTICLGKCYSAGAVLLACGTAGRRFIMPNAEVMIHGIQFIFPSVQDPSQVDQENYLNYLNKTNDNIMKILAKQTGHPLKKVKEDCKQDLWMSPKEALNYGLVDHIL
jgi:ATP-dependent Clp protease protease subunit